MVTGRPGLFGWSGEAAGAGFLVVWTGAVLALAPLPLPGVPGGPLPGLLAVLVAVSLFAHRRLGWREFLPGMIYALLALVAIGIVLCLAAAVLLLGKAVL